MINQFLKSWVNVRTLDRYIIIYFYDPKFVKKKTKVKSISCQFVRQYIHFINLKYSNQLYLHTNINMYLYFLVKCNILPYIYNIK